MRHQALGMFWDGLLHADTHGEFATLVDQTADTDSIPARAGGILLGQVVNKQFIDQLVDGLVNSLESVFWVEMRERLINGTTCQFQGFGTFKRFVSTISFIPARLWENPALLRSSRTRSCRSMPTLRALNGCITTQW